MNAKESLIAARKKIEDPKNWASCEGDISYQKECAFTAVHRTTKYPLKKAAH